MGEGYDAAGWHDFAVMVGSSSAALTGLLFVAVSSHLGTMLATPALRHRSLAVLVGFLAGFLGSALLLIPQGRIALGVEVIVLNVAAFYYARHWAAAVRKSRESVPKGVRMRWTLSRIAGGLCFAGGVSLVAHVGGGIYLIEAALLIIVVTAALAAWELFVGVSEQIAR